MFMANSRDREKNPVAVWNRTSDLRVQCQARRNVLTKPPCWSGTFARQPWSIFAAKSSRGHHVTRKTSSEPSLLYLQGAACQPKPPIAKKRKLGVGSSCTTKLKYTSRPARVAVCGRVALGCMV